MAINGRKYDWESITINLPHGELIGVDSIDYSDKVNIERQYGKGSMPIGYGQGNYEAEGKLSLLRDEYEKLLENAKGKSKPFFKMDPFSITVSYANKDEEVKTDTLPSCLFTERSRAAKQGDTSIKVELSFLVLDPIEEDGLAAYE